MCLGEKFFWKKQYRKGYTMLVSQRYISNYSKFSIPDCRQQLITTQTASRLKFLGTTTLHIQAICILL